MLLLYNKFGGQRKHKMLYLYSKQNLSKIFTKVKDEKQKCVW